MENRTFNFSTRSDKTGVFALSFFLRNLPPLIWASVVTMIFAFKGSFLAMVVFLVAFFALWYLIWPRIWICCIQFNPEKTTLETFVEGFKDSIEEMDISKVASCKKETMLKTNLKSVLLILKGFIGILMSISAAAFLGTLVLGAWLWYVAFALLIAALVLILGIKPFGNKEFTKFTLSHPTDIGEKSVETVEKTGLKTGDGAPLENAADSEQGGAEKEEKAVTYEVFAYSQEDEAAFERFLKECFTAAGRTDLQILSD